MFEGTKFTLGDRELVVPALSLGQLRRGALELFKKNDELWKKVEAGEAIHWEALANRAELILMALRRNYPDLAEEWLLDHLDFNNVAEIWKAVVGLTIPGEAKAPTANGQLTPSTTN